MNRIVSWAVVTLLGCAPRAGAQRAVVRPASSYNLPAAVDSNSPAFWANGELIIYNSTGGDPIKSSGSNQFKLENSQAVAGPPLHRPYWIEATWVDTAGAIFAWYHHEPPGICGDAPLTAPEIGALVSYDQGNSFLDMGIVLQSGYASDCSAQNGYFAGGHGDFSVLEGRDHQYLYFLFSNYGGPLESQGVAIARMPIDRRYTPVGAVEKYYDGAWQEPGVGGRVTAIFPAIVAWNQPNVDSFWGPSVHWNGYLQKFVMLLNHSCCSPGWPQEGIYISFNSSLSDPGCWTAPVKILDSSGWYPQVLGLGPLGTDKRAGRVARLYVGGASAWEIVFDPRPTVSKRGRDRSGRRPEDHPPAEDTCDARGPAETPR